VFLIAAATDVVDGFLARWLNQKSRLGALLDPIADKLLMLVALIVGLSIGQIPAWLAIVIIGRDTILGIGAILFATRWRDRHGPASWRPTRIGKYAMALQSAMLILVILDTTTRLRLRAYAEAAMVAAALATVVAGGQYVYRAARALAR